MSLTHEVEEILAGLSGHTGVYARRLDGRGETVELHADTNFTLASVVKLPILIHVLALAQAGKVSLTERREQTEADRLPGSGLLQRFLPGLKPTVHDLLYLMMDVSDNQATDAILALSTKQAVEADMHARGYGTFFMPHSIREVLYSLAPDLPSDASYDDITAAFREPGFEYPEEPDGGSAEVGNRCTPRDIAAMLVDLHEGRALDPEHTELALNILKACMTNSRIPQGVPYGTPVAHKTGTFRSRANDAGIVYAPTGPYVLALFVHGEPDEKAASGALARVSEAVFRAYASEG